MCLLIALVHELFRYVCIWCLFMCFVISLVRVFCMLFFRTFVIYLFMYFVISFVR